MIDHRERWALILGASSGFGEATALALAADGYHIAGVHLDRRQGMERVAAIKRKIEAHGSKALFFNGNAADDANRSEVIRTLGDVFAESRAGGAQPYVRVMMHSLAFGTLKPYLLLDPAAAINRKNMEMTLDVMANSLVYWAQDAWRAGMFAEGSKVYAMTSEGSVRVSTTYGAVSAAKAALESHCRQLAMEFAKLRSGVTVNAIRAGVTLTPALMQIPEKELLIAHGMANPNGRMTTVEDVAQAIVTLSGTGTHWITGNVLGIDGGELILRLTAVAASARDVPVGGEPGQGIEPMTPGGDEPRTGASGQGIAPSAAASFAPAPPVPDRTAAVRDHLANERTLLAWQRTALALVGLGFVIDRFAFEGSTDKALLGTLVGMGMIIAGGLAALVGVQRFVKVERQIDTDSYRPAIGIHLVFAGAILVAAIVMVAYLALAKPA